MAKISKSTADEVSIRMANYSFKNRERNVRKEIEELCETIVKDQIPQGVIDFCEKWKEYISYQFSVSIQCLDKQGATRCLVSSHVSTPVPYKKSSLVVSGEYSDRLCEASRKLTLLKREKDILKNNILNTLLDLGTTKRIEEAFPSAVPYLKAVNISVGFSDKPCQCEQLKKMLEVEREKEKAYERQ